MSCVVMMHLYGKPGWDMEIENREVDPKELERKGEEIRDWLNKVAEQIRIFKKNGCEVTGTLFDAECLMWGTESLVWEKLKDMGIDTSMVCVMDIDE